MPEETEVYTVRACRWGDPETHSYIVGVYTDYERARIVAKNEETWRGGSKYICEIQRFRLDDRRNRCVTVKPLPEINTIKSRMSPEGASHGQPQ